MNPENVLAEFARAKKSLQAAQILQERGLSEDAVSRGYYAVMHAARAALLVHDSIAESHSAVRRLFGEILVRPGFLEKEWSAVLAREQTQRVVADYTVQIVWNSEASSALVTDAQAFVQRIGSYLESRGIVPQE